MTSAVGSLFSALHHTMGQSNEYSDFIDDKQRAPMLRGLFELYYKDHTWDIIIDTNRLWCARLPLLLTRTPKLKQRSTW